MYMHTHYKTSKYRCQLSVIAKQTRITRSTR